MAQAAKDLNQDDVAEGQAAPAPKKGGMLKYILIAAGVLALIGVSVGVSVYMATSATGDTTADGKAAEKKAVPKITKTPFYYKFDPPFVVNFNASSNYRFLQVQVEVLTYDQAVIPVIEQNLPVIQNNLIFLLSDLTADQIMSNEGKAKIREDSLKVIQQVIADRTGKPGVEEVYFTSFVMQ